MTDRWLTYFGHLLAVTGFILARRLLGPPVFRVEFVVEDLILLLALANGLAPVTVQPLIWGAISCSISITMAVMGWTTGTRTFPTGKSIFSTSAFAVLAARSAARVVRELSKLRKTG